MDGALRCALHGLTAVNVGYYCFSSAEAPGGAGVEAPLPAVVGVAAPAGVPVPLGPAEGVAVLGTAGAGAAAAAASSSDGFAPAAASAAALGGVKASAGARWRMASSMSWTPAADAWRMKAGKGHEEERWQKMSSLCGTSPLTLIV